MAQAGFDHLLAHVDPFLDEVTLADCHQLYLLFQPGTQIAAQFEEGDQRDADRRDNDGNRHQHDQLCLDGFHDPDATQIRLGSGLCQILSAI